MGKYNINKITCGISIIELQGVNVTLVKKSEASLIDIGGMFLFLL